MPVGFALQDSLILSVPREWSLHGIIEGGKDELLNKTIEKRLVKEKQREREKISTHPNYRFSFLSAGMERKATFRPFVSSVACSASIN